MNTNDDKQRRLGALTRELDDVRTGRSIRRRATFGLAAVALVATAAWMALPTSQSAPTSPPTIAQVDPPPPAVLVTEPAPTPAPSYNSIRVVQTSPTATLQHVEIIDDEGLARALRASGTQGGVARVNGRVILTGSLAKEPASESEGEESPAVPSAL